MNHRRKSSRAEQDAAKRRRYQRAMFDMAQAHDAKRDADSALN